MNVHFKACIPSAIMIGLFIYVANGSENAVQIYTWVCLGIGIVLLWVAVIFFDYKEKGKEDVE